MKNGKFEQYAEVLEEARGKAMGSQELPLKRIIELSGVPRQTLWRWKFDKPKLYAIVQIGCYTVEAGSDN